MIKKPAPLEERLSKLETVFFETEYRIGTINTEIFRESSKLSIMERTQEMVSENIKALKDSSTIPVLGEYGKAVREHKNLEEMIVDSDKKIRNLFEVLKKTQDIREKLELEMKAIKNAIRERKTVLPFRKSPWKIN